MCSGHIPLVQDFLCLSREVLALASNLIDLILEADDDA
jgi:hypothetical protein